MSGLVGIFDARILQTLRVSLDRACFRLLLIGVFKFYCKNKLSNKFMYNLHSIFYLNDVFGKSQLFSTNSSLVMVQNANKKEKVKRDRVKIRKN